MLSLPGRQLSLGQGPLVRRKAEGEPEPVVLPQQVVLDHEVQEAVGHEVEQVRARAQHQGLAHLKKIERDAAYKNEP